MWVHRVKWSYSGGLPFWTKLGQFSSCCIRKLQIWHKKPIKTNMKKKSQPRYSISLVFFLQNTCRRNIYILEERELKSRKLLKNLECPKQEKFHFSMRLDQSIIKKIIITWHLSSYCNNFVLDDLFWCQNKGQGTGTPNQKGLVIWNAYQMIDSQSYDKTFLSGPSFDFKESSITKL